MPTNKELLIEMLETLNETKECIRIAEQVSASRKYKWILGPLITIIIVFAGVMSAWATTVKDVDMLKQDSFSSKAAIHELEIAKAAETQVLQIIQTDVAEIKQDIKKIRR